jgi:hypothetical protein
VTVPSEAGEQHGEHRWPMAVAVLVVAVLHSLLPRELTLQSSPFLPWIALVALIALILLDPGRINRIQTASRVITDVLIGLLTVSNAYAAAMLVVGIIDNDSFADARTLLFAGGAVWVTNAILFALWYWDLDRGGPAERAFSPTDVSAVKPWAKLMVVVESVISLGLAALVIARAINVIA